MIRRFLLVCAVAWFAQPAIAATWTPVLGPPPVGAWCISADGTQWVPMGGVAGNCLPAGMSPTTPSYVIGFDSGSVSVSATPANSSHAAGTSIGGLMSVALARVVGGSGIITNLNFKSIGGSTGTYVVRLWQKNPTGTTCADNTAFAGADADDANLITAPFSITAAAPASTTGDSATYASLGGLTLDYKNLDGTPSQNIYACLVTVATDTADDNHLIRLTLAGPQN